MSMKFKTLIIVLVVSLKGLQAQTESAAYWVYFKDKNGVKFNPYSYFHKNAIERRVNAGIDLDDISDYPLNQHFVNEVKQYGDSVTIESRWFNAIKIWGVSHAQLNIIASLPYVLKIEESTKTFLNTAKVNENQENTALNSNKILAHKQLENLGLSTFKQVGLDGKGVRVAVFDAGFPNLDKHDAFAEIRAEKRIVGTFNFLKNSSNVYQGGVHGTMTTGCIAGKTKEMQIGLAVGCELLLAITEYNQREPYREEEFWLAAAEWADKNGADIISSSLGYTFERYFYKDMDGKTSLVSKAARMAVRKGMLVVNSAGNEYANPWLFIITPADVDSVLTVGGIDPGTGYHISFSSIGPNSKNVMKPNVCAFGHVTTSGKRGLIQVDGTSFSCPLVSGFAACALQAFPEFKGKPMELYDLIQRSSSLFPYFDYMHGFGVPQAGKLLKTVKEKPPTFDFVFEDNALSVKLKETAARDSLLNAPKPLYYHIENENGVILDYYLITADLPDVLRLEYRLYKRGQKVMIHYDGYTASYTF